MPKENEISWPPLTSVEQVLLNERWSKLWPSDAQSIQAAVRTMRSQGFDAIHRCAYSMAMRTRTMPSAYWPAD